MPEEGETTATPGLVVFVRGLRDDLATVNPLLDELRMLPQFEGYDYLVYPHSKKVPRRGSLAELGDDLAAAIANRWDTEENQPSTVILMGHSIGGLVARHAYLVAAGGFDRPVQQWATRVARIVLFAAPNAGVDVKRYNPLVSTAYSLGLSLTHGWTVAGAVRGAPFLANLRIEWMRRIPAMSEPPLVVQVCGTSDKTVRIADSVDLEAMPNSVQVVIDGADHASIIQPRPAGEDRPGQQLKLLLHAITGTFSESERAAKPRPDVSTVVFLLHGIRAGIFGWVERLKEILQATSGVAGAGPSYGYYSAYKFMLPWGHDRQLRWFADQYASLLSTYGPAKFHFVGHSNGTYILGRSLRRVPAITFDRIYLAGSVLPTDFQWSDHSRQVGEVVNACGSKDVPVGVLCKALRGVGRRDLGTGGYNGFDDNTLVKQQYVTLQGSGAESGHGAGLVDDRLPGVAGYLLTGAVPAGGGWATRPPAGGFDTLSKFSGWLARLLALGLVAVPVLLGVWHLWAALTAVLAAVVVVLIVLSAI